MGLGQEQKNVGSFTCIYVITDSKYYLKYSEDIFRAVTGCFGGVRALKTCPSFLKENVEIETNVCGFRTQLFCMERCQNTLGVW